MIRRYTLSVDLSNKDCATIIKKSNDGDLCYYKDHIEEMAQLKFENERLTYGIKNIMINIFELWEFYMRKGDDRAQEYKKIFDDLNKVVSGE